MPLSGGVSLDAEACDAFLRERGGDVIGLVAGPNVGKTTLVATMYELLHRRRMTGFGFAGSETLRGYEERCHLARSASMGETPDTPHTPTRSKLSFTHLRIAAAGRMRDIVFSDRSGEHFDNVLSQPGSIAKFGELQRADAILLLVDLDSLVKETHLVESNMRRLFLALKQTGLLKDKRLFLVGTKADIAIPTPRSRKAVQEIESLAQDLRNRTEGEAEVKVHLVASRSRTGSTVIGEGIEPLLKDLLLPRLSAKPEYSAEWPPVPSELDLLVRGYRRARL